MSPNLGQHALGSWGNDVSSYRVDALDLACSQYALSTGGESPRGVDLGCGLGAVSVALAALGVQMLLVDIRPLEGRFETICSLLPTSTLIFRRLDARMLTDADFGSRNNFCYSRRFIHYLTHEEAGRLVQRISQNLVDDGHVFISASGIGSELGVKYRDADKPVERRFAFLEPDMAQKHNIGQRVCLYTENDLSELFQRRGFRTIKTWRSNFGNIQGIFSKGPHPTA